MVKTVALNHEVKQSNTFIIAKWHFELKPNRLPCIKARFNAHYTPVIEFQFASMHNLNGASPLIQLLNEFMNAVPIERTIIIRNFAFNTVTHELMMFFDMLKQSQSVVHIRFDSSPNSSVLDDMLKQLVGKTNLKTLSFKHVHLKASKTESALPILGTLPNLKHFTFKRSTIGSTLSYLNLFNIIETILHHVPGLTNLSLTSNNNTLDFCPIALCDDTLARLAAMSSLKVLKLGFTIPAFQHLPRFIEALANNRTLEELDVVDTFRNFSKRAPFSLAYKTPTPYLSGALIHNTHLKKIHYNAGFRSGDNANLGTLITNNTSLTSLNLVSTCYISAEEMKSFADSLSTNTTLKSLSLENCIVHPGCFEILGAALAQNTTLENLKMDNMNSIKFNRSVPKFFASLRHNKGLRVLSFQTFRDVFDVSALWPALLHHPTLETLRVTVATRNDSKDQTLGLYELLSTNTTLCDIDIDWEVYNTAEVELFSRALVGAVVNNKNLLRLIFPYSLAVETSLKPLYSIIQHTNTNLMFTEPGGRVAKPSKLVYQVLKRNRSLNTTLFQLLFPIVTWIDPIDEEPIEFAFTKRLRLN